MHREGKYLPSSPQHKDQQSYDWLSVRLQTKEQGGRTSWQDTISAVLGSQKLDIVRFILTFVYSRCTAAIPRCYQTLKVFFPRSTLPDFHKSQW